MDGMGTMNEIGVVLYEGFKKLWLLGLFSTRVSKPHHLIMFSDRVSNARDGKDNRLLGQMASRLGLDFQMLDEMGTMIGWRKNKTKT